MIAVLDASVAVGLATRQPQAERFGEALANASLVLAPDLFVAEVCNAIWKYRRSDLLTAELADNILSHALGLADRLEPALTLYREAFALATSYGHPVYDTLYLVLARRNDAVLLTLDLRLAGFADAMGLRLG